MSRPAVLNRALQLAARPEGFSNGDLAKAAELSATAAGACITRYVEAGHIFRAKPEGQHSRYFDTQERADAYRQGHEKSIARTDEDPVATARAAAKVLRNGKVHSSSAIAEILQLQPAVVDAALAPLHARSKLTRVAVRRGVVSEFDYRLDGGLTDEDFAACQGATVAPTANVGPVAPATPGPIVVAAPKPSAGGDRSASARAGASGQRVGGELERAFNQRAESLGWAGAQSPSPGPQPSATEPQAFRDLVEAVADVDPITIEATDPVTALNSRGELALDCGDGFTIKFKPAHTVQLARFLAGNLTWLDQLGERA